MGLLTCREAARRKQTQWPEQTAAVVEVHHQGAMHVYCDTYIHRACHTITHLPAGSDVLPALRVRPDDYVKQENQKARATLKADVCHAGYATMKPGYAHTNCARMLTSHALALK